MVPNAFETIFSKKNQIFPIFSRFADFMFFFDRLLTFKGVSWGS